MISLIFRTTSIMPVRCYGQNILANTHGPYADLNTNTPGAQSSIKNVAETGHEQSTNKVNLS
jgi:hypothetical protein